MKIANKILQDSWNGLLPIDPVAIAESIKVKNANGQWCKIEVVGRSSLALNGASGQCLLSTNKNGDTVFKCEFNFYENALRSRFVIAHELGHILLGHIKQEDDIKRDDAFTKVDNEEDSANHFAYELLMPEERVINLFQGEATVKQMADIFYVSETSMEYRLKNLGLIL